MLSEQMCDGFSFSLFGAAWLYTLVASLIVSTEVTTGRGEQVFMSMD
jgi:hypothetical protein